jgi:peptidoglycan hydrolase CwlO-like protein
MSVQQDDLLKRIDDKLGRLGSEAWSVSERITYLKREISNLEIKLAQLTGAIEVLQEVREKGGAE